MSLTRKVCLGGGLTGAAVGAVAVMGGGIRRKLDELIVPEVAACVRVPRGSMYDCWQSPELPARMTAKRDELIELGVGFWGGGVALGIFFKLQKKLYCCDYVFCGGMWWEIYPF